MNEEAKVKHCIACQAEIPLSATVCSNCSTHQNKLYNIFQSLGASVGVISAILAFASYVISSAPAVRQALWWVDDVNVLAYSDENVVIGNNGDGEVFVSHIFIEAEAGGLTTIRMINKSLEVGEILTVEIFPVTEMFTVVSGVTDSAWENYLDLAIQETDSAAGNCIGMYFYSESDPVLRLYSNALGDDLRKVNATATIYYFSNKLGVELNKQFPVYGILLEFEKSCIELNE